MIAEEQKQSFLFSSRNSARPMDVVIPIPAIESDSKRGSSKRRTYRVVVGVAISLCSAARSPQPIGAILSMHNRLRISKEIFALCGVPRLLHCSFRITQTQSNIICWLAPTASNAALLPLQMLQLLNGRAIRGKRADGRAIVRDFYRQRILFFETERFFVESSSVLCSQRVGIVRQRSSAIERPQPRLHCMTLTFAKQSSARTCFSRVVLNSKY